jgi:hypothetical protein
VDAEMIAVENGDIESRRYFISIFALHTVETRRHRLVAICGSGTVIPSDSQYCTAARYKYGIKSYRLEIGPEYRTINRPL